MHGATVRWASEGGETVAGKVEGIVAGRVEGITAGRPWKAGQGTARGWSGKGERTVVGRGGGEKKSIALAKMSYIYPCYP